MIDLTTVYIFLTKENFQNVDQLKTLVEEVPNDHFGQNEFVVLTYSS